jgi:hypothetical protein
VRTDNPSCGPFIGEDLVPQPPIGDAPSVNGE